MSSRTLSIAVVVLVVAGVTLTAAVRRDDRTRRMTAALTASPTVERGPAITAAGIAAHLDALQRIADGSDGTRAAGTVGSAATGGCGGLRHEHGPGGRYRDRDPQPLTTSRTP